MIWNTSSNSYDLLIKNITDSHLGLYYCGTEELNGEKGNKKESVYTYGKIITRILFGKLTIFVVNSYEFNILSYVGILCKCVRSQALFKDGQDVLIGGICAATISTITITFTIPTIILHF